MLRILNVLLFSVLLSCTFAATSAFAAALGGASFDQVQQAAINGDPDAEYALGYMYYYGKGVTRDEQAATMWIQKAAVQGQPQAIKAVKLLGLTPPPDAGATATTSPPANPEKAASVAGITQQSAKPIVRKAVTKTHTVTKPMPVVEQHHAELHPENRTAQEKLLLDASPSAYTIQLLGAYNQEDILNFIKAHGIQSKALYYKTSYQGRPWYVLVYGIYKSNAEAVVAVKRLPESVQTLKPWVKSLEAVQHGIRSGVE